MHSRLTKRYCKPRSAGAEVSLQGDRETRELMQGNNFGPLVHLLGQECRPFPKIGERQERLF
jgi:hypothetical protein